MKHEAIKKARKRMGFAPDVLELYEEVNPELLDVIEKFDEIVLKDGALPTKIKRLISFAIVVSQQAGEYCIEQQLKSAINAGASKEEILETLSVVLMTSGAPAVASSRDVVSGIKDWVERL